MQQVRLWEITADRKLSEIPARYASLEQWIEDWLADDNPTSPSNGFCNSTPSWTKSLTFRVTTVSRCTMAVAAIMASSLTATRQC